MHGLNLRPDSNVAGVYEVNARWVSRTRKWRCANSTK